MLSTQVGIKNWRAAFCRGNVGVHGERIEGTHSTLRDAFSVNIFPICILSGWNPVFTEPCARIHPRFILRFHPRDDACYPGEQERDDALSTRARVCVRALSRVAFAPVILNIREDISILVGKHTNSSSAVHSCHGAYVLVATRIPDARRISCGEESERSTEKSAVAAPTDRRNVSPEGTELSRETRFPDAQGNSTTLSVAAGRNESQVLSEPVASKTIHLNVAPLIHSRFCSCRAIHAVSHITETEKWNFSVLPRNIIIQMQIGRIARIAERKCCNVRSYLYNILPD